MADEQNVIRGNAVAVSMEMYNALVVSAHRYRVLMESVLNNSRWYNEHSADEAYNGYVSSADILSIVKAFEPDMYDHAKAAYFAKKAQEEEARAAKEEADWKAKLVAEKVQGDIWSGDEADKNDDEEEDF